MEKTLDSLQPAAVWDNFVALNAVPRPSKGEERIVQFMVSFGKSLGLETLEDAHGNVLIRKPATPGMEACPVVVLQAHLDMVHQKNDATDFDFATEGIRMVAEGDWVRAEGTTLGADNGLGVAAIMAVLRSESLAHPPLEALFTTDEETGMTGAKGLQPGWLRGELLLNLDTEEDDELGVGCAGGIDVTGSASYDPVRVPEGWTGMEIRLTGLNGGHSGMDIHKGLGNANKLLGRLLYTVADTTPFGLYSFHGGNLRNAIPREARAVVALPPGTAELFLQALDPEIRAVREEYAGADPGLVIDRSTCGCPGTRMPEAEQENFLRCLEGLHNGVQAMSREFPGQTETSNNVARVEAGDGQVRIGCLTRSSREAAKAHLVRRLEAVFSLAGYQTETSGAYPGWQPDPESGLLKLLSARYQALFGQEPRIMAGHGGLECGILKDRYPQLDVISFGPTIRGAHSPQERASVSSTAKFWKLLTDVLAHIPSGAS